MVPKVLSDEQKEKRTELCCDLLEQIDGVPSFLKSVITADETWIFMYDPGNQCIGKRHLPQEQKSTHESFEVQGNAYRFLQYPGHCYGRMGTQWSNS